MPPIMDIIASLRGSTPSGDFSKTISADRFALSWARLCAAYPRQETTTATAEVYFERLKGFTEEQVQKAVDGAIDKQKFFPSVAEILAEIGGERGCIHRVILADITLREEALLEAEKQQQARLIDIGKQIGQLTSARNSLSAEIFARERQLIEESKLPEARRELGAVQAAIEKERAVLADLRKRVKFFDQARIVQGKETVQ